MTAQTTSATTATGERESRHAPLILTLYGLYARGEHNWLSVASLIGLMADLGVESRAVRSSVSRMKRREVLRGERREGVAGYSLADSTLQTLAEGDVRIFHRARASREDGWTLVVFSVPESEREKRHALRTALTRLGFGTVASGVWVAPGHLADEARRTLERRGLSGYVDLFTGDHFASGDLGAKVRSWWDLDELTAMYADFLDRYRPVLDAVTRREPQPLEAFRIYLPMLTEWRRMPYRDPGLPLELLPPEWNGVAAGELFDRLNTALSTPAAAHAARVLHGPR
ncbi:MULTISPECIES: PaaX family transcriptional regulator [Streptomyces violaceusniger group]|uniref:PaaX family transcriptional regulator C-terminal domain-containing protein n=2 Tax=Streptomyces javensis TaxID=114698 RepID=A0ABP4H3Z8_9ACTN|nr:PaaX family transcriptional regulator C-terminal domain-containing protein [Streptomyces javensis]MBI0311551.1 PaaX family transcriptional regulator [Streptomyces javensis]